MPGSGSVFRAHRAPFCTTPLSKTDCRLRRSQKTILKCDLFQVIWRWSSRRRAFVQEQTQANRQNRMRCSPQQNAWSEYHFRETRTHLETSLYIG
jgi:hypothetical protein